MFDQHQHWWANCSKFIEEEFNWEAAFALYGILAGVVLVFLGPTLYIFISQDIYFKEMNYIWVSAYFVA